MSEPSPQEWIEIKCQRALRDLVDAMERGDTAMQQEAENLLFQLHEERLGMIPLPYAVNRSA
jgi:hypothetical protein